MFCETYRCEMNAAACVVRQRNAQHDGSFGTKAGSTDINCRDCAQGRQVAADTELNMVAQYSAGLKRARKNVLDKITTRPDRKEDQGGNDMESSQTKVCTRKQCTCGGKPQPLENFGRNVRKPDRKQDWCKECFKEVSRIRYMKSNAQAKNEQDDAITKNDEVMCDERAAVQSSGDILDNLFIDHPELLEVLQDIAKAKMRTPVNQLLYLVKEAAHALQA